MTRLGRVAKAFVVALLCSVIASGGYAQDSKKRKRSSQVMSKAVATKLIVSQTLPPVTYQTLLEKCECPLLRTLCRTVSAELRGLLA